MLIVSSKCKPLVLSLLTSLGLFLALPLLAAPPAKLVASTSPLASWADSVAAANRQRYCNQHLSADELVARLDSAPADSYRTADAILGLPADFRDNPVPAAANPYMELYLKIDGLNHTSVYLNRADKIRIIPVGTEGCDLTASPDVDLQRSYLGNPLDWSKYNTDSSLANKFALHFGVGSPQARQQQMLLQKVQELQALTETKFIVRQPAADTMISAGVYPKEGMPPDYWVIFVSGLGRPFTLDVIAYWAHQMTISQLRTEDWNANIAKRFPLKVRELRLMRDKSDDTTIGIATDLDSYYQLRAKADKTPPPIMKRYIKGYMDAPSSTSPQGTIAQDVWGQTSQHISQQDTINSRALAAMRDMSRSRGLSVVERSHRCVTPKATCKLTAWTSLGASCQCEYVSGRHMEYFDVCTTGQFGTSCHPQDEWRNDYATAKGKIMPE